MNAQDLKTIRFDAQDILDYVFGSPKGVTTIYSPAYDPIMATNTECPVCHQLAKTYNEAMFIKNVGECETCDHVRGEDSYRQEKELL